MFLLPGEPLSREIFDTVLEARVLTEQWRQEYNRLRPHQCVRSRRVIHMELGLRIVALLGIVAAVSSVNARELEDIAAAVAKRKSKTELSKIALSMNPGTWAEVKCKRPKSLMAVTTGKTASGKRRGYHIAGWTDDGHWDSRTGQFLYMGFRKRLKFIAYSETDNEWRVIPGPFGWDTINGEPGKGTFEDTRRTHFGHVYGKNAHDRAKGAFYHCIGGHSYRYSLAEKVWTRFRGGSGMSMEFFPGLGLMSHNPVKNKKGVGRLAILDEETKTWAALAEVPFTQHHAMARYNPHLKEMLLIAGNNSTAVVKVDAKGTVTRLKDVPFPITIRHGKLLVDPVSGRYLIFLGKELHDFDSVKNEYRKVEGYKAPWSKYEMPVPAAIPEYEVVMFIDRKLMLYKHDAPPFAPGR